MGKFFHFPPFHWLSNSKRYPFRVKSKPGPLGQDYLAGRPNYNIVAGIGLQLHGIFASSEPAGGGATF